jgi:hypothetical protein
MCVPARAREMGPQRGSRGKTAPWRDTYSSDTERKGGASDLGSWINDLPAEFYLVAHINALSKDTDGEVIVRWPWPN